MSGHWQPLCPFFFVNCCFSPFLLCVLGLLFVYLFLPNGMVDVNSFAD